MIRAIVERTASSCSVRNYARLAAQCFFNLRIAKEAVVRVTTHIQEAQGPQQKFYLPMLLYVDRVSEREGASWEAKPSKWENQDSHSR
jgi:hypothetical protein